MDQQVGAMAQLLQDYGPWGLMALCAWLSCTSTSSKSRLPKRCERRLKNMRPTPPAFTRKRSKSFGDRANALNEIPRRFQGWRHATEAEPRFLGRFATVAHARQTNRQSFSLGESTGFKSASEKNFRHR